MAAKQVTLTPRYCIQHSRHSKQDGWLLWDISVQLSGNIAVTSSNVNTYQTSIDVYSVRNSDSRDKPKMIYSKQFEKYSDEKWIYLAPHVSFIDDDVLVSCHGYKLELFQVSKDEVLRSRRVNGNATCLSVREREIFIGFKESNKITVYDVIDLNEIKSIILQGIQDGYCPYDMTAKADRIFVCVSDGKEGSVRRSLIFEEKNGRILSELTKPTDTVNWYAHSITVCVTLGVLAVRWVDSLTYKEGVRFQIVFYSLFSENNSSFLIVEIESGVYRIRISDRGDRMVTGNWWTGEVKVYDMAEFFTYSHFKEKLVSTLQSDDCTSLANFFNITKNQTDAILSSDTPSENLLLVLEEKGVLQPYNIDRLTEAFHELKINPFCCHVAEFYQKTRVQQSSQTEAISSLPGPSGAPIRENLSNSAAKRTHREGDHSDGDNGCHGKRAKASEMASGTTFPMGSTDRVIEENSSLNQLITQIHQAPSLFPLMEGYTNPNHSNFNIPSPATPVVMSTMPRISTQVETLASPMVARPTVSHQSSIGTNGLDMSFLQVSSLGTQQTGQVMSTPCPVREVQTNIQSLGPSTAQQGYMAVTSQHQTLRQSRQSIIPQTLTQSGYLMSPVFGQHRQPPQLQSIGQLITPQREEFAEQNVAATEHQQNGRSEGQFMSQNLRQNAGQQEIQHVAQSFPPARTQPVSLNTGQNEDDVGSTTMPRNPHQARPMRNENVEQRRAQQNIHQTIQLEQPNNLSHGRQATVCSVEQQHSTTEPRTTCNINQTHRTESESVATTSQGISEEINTAVECCFQKVVTPLLKDINNKLGHLFGSSSTPSSWQDIPGTSSQSDNNVLDSAAHARNLPDSEPDQEVISAWESLSEDDRMSLRAFTGMTDDRAELVRRLVEMVFTEEERHNRNCFGKSGKQKLDANKLRKMRHITFYLCPIKTKKTDIDKLNLEDVEWKRLCEVIDKSNRHFREKQKRQENRR